MLIENKMGIKDMKTRTEKSMELYEMMQKKNWMKHINKVSRKLGI